MAVGLPVILSPDFAPSFGDAALYAEADEVWPLAERLWRDRGFWEARAARRPRLRRRELRLRRPAPSPRAARRRRSRAGLMRPPESATPQNPRPEPALARHCLAQVRRLERASAEAVGGWAGPSAP